jgi:MFS family permease
VTEDGLSQNTDFLRLWISGVVSVLGTAISSLTFPLLALAVADSVAQAGLVGLLGLGAGAAVRLPAGVLVDRVPVRLVLVSTDLVRLLVTAAVLVGVVSGRIALWELALAAALNAGAAAVHDVARSVAMRRVVAAPQLTRAFALDEGRNHVTSLLGQPLGGLLYGVAPALPLAVDVLSFATSAGLSARISDPLRPTPGLRGNARAEMVTGLVFVWRQPLLRTALLAAAGFQLVFAAAVFALIATLKAAGTSPGQLGLLFGVAGFGGVAGALATTRMRHHFSLHVLVTSMGAVAALVFALLAELHQPLVVGLLLGSIFFLSAPANAVLLAAQVTCTPLPLQGRAMSASYLIAGLVAPLGPPLAGTALDHIGPTTTFLGVATATALVSIAVHLRRSTLTPVRTRA